MQPRSQTPSSKFKQIEAAARSWVRKAKYGYLRRRALSRRNRSKAAFVGITGSSGKTTTMALVADILGAAGRVRHQAAESRMRLFVKQMSRLSSRCDYVVTELGVGRIGQMKPMAEMVRPDVAVVTLVGLEHKSAFRTAEAVMNEKADLMPAVRPGGIALLNADDPLVMEMRHRTAERIVTFGREQEADYRACDVSAVFPDRLRLTMVWGDQSLRLRTNFVGEHLWLPTLAAAATAIELGVPPQIVAERIAGFEPLFARCGLLAVPDGPIFIVDTTKAPLHSLKLAFEMVQGARALRKRIVLGHISDFAGSDSKYRDAYVWARSAADQVVFVGNHAHRSKASERDRSEGRFFSFATPEEAADHIRKTAAAGELILLKGSIDLHLERIALSFVHDVKCWVPACKKMEGCIDCGRYEDPFEWHRGDKKRGRIKRYVSRLISEKRGQFGDGNG